MKKPLLIILSIFALASFVYANGKAQGISIPIETSKHVLENGMTVLISEMPNKETVALYALVKTGSATEGEFLGTGISHFLEHMLFKGTPKRGVGQIPAEIQSAGGYINASTGYDYTIYTITLPYRSFDLGLDVLSDMIMNSKFDAEELEKEREVVYNEMRLYRDRPSRRLNELVQATAYNKHPYKYPVIGFKDLLAGLKRQDFLDYYHNTYSPNNIIFSIAGKVNTQETLKRVKETFSEFKMRRYHLRNLPREPQQLGLRRHEEEYPTQLTRMALAFQGVSVNESDMYSLDVLSMILGKGETSRLYLELFKKQGLVRSISSYNYTPIDKGLFEVHATLDKINIEEVIQQILRQIQQIKDKGVDEDELKKVKRQVISENVSQYRKPDHVAYAAAIDEAFVGNHDFSKHYVNVIQELDSDDIQRVARRYLNEDQLSIVIVRPQEETEEIAHADLSQMVKPVTRHELKNGLTLLVREDHSLPLVKIQVSMLGGTRQEIEALNGISELTSRLLPKSTKKRSARELSESVEARGASFGGFSGKNSFGLGFSSLTDDLDFGIELVAETLKYPAFDSNEMLKEKEKLKTAIIARDDSISSITSRALRRELFGTHPYRLDDIGTLESIENISRDNIIRFYERNLRANKMVISVFGDVTTSEVLSKAEKAFAWIKSDERKEEALGVAPVNALKEETLRLDKEQAMVMVGFQGVSLFHNDYFGLEVLSSILGSSFNGRLFKNIREESGHAYSTGGQSLSSMDTGMVYFYALTTDENVEDVYNMIKEQLEMIRTEGVEDGEINDIKTYLKGQFHSHLETNSALSYKSSLDELYGRGYDFYLSYDDKIDAVTAQQVKKLADKYLDINRGVAVLSRPKSAEKPPGTITDKPATK